MLLLSLVLNNTVLLQELYALYKLEISPAKIMTDFPLKNCSHGNEFMLHSIAFIIIG